MIEIDLEIMWDGCLARLPKLSPADEEFAKTFFMLGIVDTLSNLRDRLPQDEVLAAMKALRADLEARYRDLLDHRLH